MVQLRRKKIITDPKSKAMRLYGQTSMWKAMLKVGGTGLLMSFMMALFTFVDQLMLINLMPTAHALSFDNLFIHGQDHVFSPLMSVISNFNSATVNAIANVSGLGLISSADIVRSSVSLSTALIFLIQMLPTIVSMGVVILYSKSLGTRRLDSAKEIWQNSLVATSLSAVIGFVLLMILIPTVTPTQATEMRLSVSDVQNTASVINQHLVQQGLNPDFFNGSTYTIYTNGTEYFVPVFQNNKTVYLNVTNSNLMNGSLLIVDNINNLSPISFSTTQLINSWNQYFVAVRQYSITWAEHFLYIMTAGMILECFANIFIGVLRADGEIKLTTIITVVTIAINILLDYVFISVAQIGMEGAATASLIGFVIQITILAIVIQFSKHSQTRFNDWRHIKVNWKLIGQFAKMGINNLVGAVGMTVTTILLTREITLVAAQVLPSAGSEYYISIVGAVMPFVTLFFSSVGGFAKNTVQLYSYNVGSNDQKRARQGYWYAFSYLLIVGLVIFGLFGACEPIKAGILNWFHINATSSGNQLVSAEKLMLIWMAQVPIFAFMVNAMVIFLVANRIKTAILVSLIRSLIVPIPMIYIWATIAMHGFGSDLSMIPSDNVAIWFFMSITPSYTAVYSGILFIMSTTFLYTTMFKKTTKKPNQSLGNKESNSGELVQPYIQNNQCSKNSDPTSLS